MGHRDEGDGAKAGLNWARRATGDPNVLCLALERRLDRLFLHLLCTTSIARLGLPGGCLRPEALHRKCLAFGAICLAPSPALPRFCSLFTRSFDRIRWYRLIVHSVPGQRSIVGRAAPLTAVDLPSWRLVKTAVLAGPKPAGTCDLPQRRVMRNTTSSPICCAAALAQIVVVWTPIVFYVAWKTR